MINEVPTDNHTRIELHAIALHGVKRLISFLGITFTTKLFIITIQQGSHFRLYAELFLPELPPLASRARRPHIVCTSSVCHLDVVCTLSAHCLHVICACTYVVRTRTLHPHIVCRPSAPLLMVTVGLNYLLLWQEFVIEWNLWQECWIVSFQDHVNDLRDNLCCWFSLHVKSGHCSHLICICSDNMQMICTHTDEMWTMSRCDMQRKPSTQIISQIIYIILKWKNSTFLPQIPFNNKFLSQ